MRIATWNINGLRARLDYLGLWLEDRKPHLVGLQELKLEDARFPFAEIEAMGYGAVVHGQKGWNGVALLSRDGQAKEVVRGLPGQQESGARLIGARYGDLELTSVYCPNGKHLEHGDFLSKLEWYDDLAAWLRRPSEVPRVVGGDFNVCPGPLDSWSEELLVGGMFHSAEERCRFAALLDTGLTDLYRAAHPDGTDFSWWDYRAGAFHKNQGLRIDFLLGSPGCKDRLEAVWMDRDYRKKKDGLTPSDHAPVIADFR